MQATTALITEFEVGLRLLSKGSKDIVCSSEMLLARKGGSKIHNYSKDNVTVTSLVLECRKITCLFLKNVFADTHENFKAGYLVLYGERQIGSCVLSFLMMMLLRLCTPYK